MTHSNQVVVSELIYAVTCCTDPCVHLKSTPYATTAIRQSALTEKVMDTLYTLSMCHDRQLTRQSTYITQRASPGVIKGAYYTIVTPRVAGWFYLSS